ncbi:phytanoyl-CoA dioxygenase family protein [Sphingopyxis sp. DHUNG17]|jgi:non-heme Fe2+,alpha-ketoglutarate-dependent halogenase|uniref:phytanoyl-CoA dioxygenase family protein n=1 Tax=Sphingopyxis jiangsuensis TaxID=2871171 RepID=UPI00191F78A3|nr:phytanoyl-CoA dioxygenase family protein [Sphingopyxis lutea]MBL0770116.1 phytanoyl-CoA dioxygenase family protein [Sphingopyxis lutea]
MLKIQDNLAVHYEREGYAAPLRALDPGTARGYRAALELHEARHGSLSKPHRNNPHLLFGWADRLIREPKILSAVSALLGDNLLVWGSTLFIKEPHDPGFISWHQDSTYWGLDPADVVTAWVALTDSRMDNGALCVLPKSHKMDQMPHRDTFAETNMLSRGQEIAVEVNPDETVALELEPGEMSLHHVRMVHGSGPNGSDRRRIGFAIRYLPTHVRQVSGQSDTATLVQGIDAFQNFGPERRPEQDFGEAERAFHAEIERLQHSIILNGPGADAR